MQATSLLQLSAVAQQVELTVRMIWQNQWQGMPQVTTSLQLHQRIVRFTAHIVIMFCLQVQQSLQEQLRGLLQHLFQLASALQAFAEDNKAHSQQLRFQHGTSSKVLRALLCSAAPFMFSSPLQQADVPGKQILTIYSACRLLKSSCWLIVRKNLLNVPRL